MPFVHLPNYALLQGLTNSQSQLLLSMIGLGSALGRICTGFLADRVGTSKKNIMLLYLRCLALCHSLPCQRFFSPSN